MDEKKFFIVVNLINLKSNALVLVKNFYSSFKTPPDENFGLFWQYLFDEEDLEKHFLNNPIDDYLVFEVRRVELMKRVELKK